MPSASPLPCTLPVPLLPPPTPLTTILKSDPTGNIFIGDRKVVPLQVGDEAGGTESAARELLLPPDAAFCSLCVSVRAGF